MDYDNAINVRKMFKVKCVDNEYAENVLEVNKIYNAEVVDEEHYYIEEIGIYHSERFKKEGD